MSSRYCANSEADLALNQTSIFTDLVSEVVELETLRRSNVLSAAIAMMKELHLAYLVIATEGLKDTSLLSLFLYGIFL